MQVIDRAEFQVVLLDNQSPSPAEWRRAGLGSALVHLLLLLVLVSIPRDTTVEEAAPREPRHRLTKLIDPPTRLTQKAPNKAPLTEQISVAPEIEAPQTKTVPPPKRFAPPPPVQRAGRQAVTPATPQEPPKIKPTQPAAPAQIASAPPVTPPAPPRAEPPKIVLENLPPPPKPGQGTGLLKVPTGSVQEAVQAIAGGATSRVVPDENAGPAARKQPSIEMEILSDPNGVDMKPYMLRVLQSVRRNWLSVYPESARLGLRGQVVVQFAIAPDGVISKTVYISQAPSEALNRAVISAFSMSNPLPPLPSDFKGNRVVLQFTFSYNTPR